MFAETSPAWAMGQSLIAAASGLGGVCVGAWTTARNQKKEREHARLREQLQNFYSPLLGMRSEIKAKSELRQKLHRAGNFEWQKLFEAVHDPVAKQQVHDANWPRYEKLLDHSDAQLRHELVPLYRRMLEHYSTHMWLAEKSTLTHYAALTEFVEIWNRFLEGSLPLEILKSVDHSESALFALYTDLQNNFDRLSDELRQ